MKRGNLWLLAAIVWAQPVSFERFVSAPSGWQMMGADPIYVWYLPGQEGLARQVHIWAADAFKEMTQLLDFQPEGAIIVRLHPSAYYWGQQPPKHSTGNLTPPYPIVEVFPAATRAKTAALVRSYVIAAFLEQLYFPEGNRLQNRSLLYLPDWYLWGFSFFWGEGWRNEDLSRLHSIPEEAMVRMVQRTAVPSPFYRSLYKSLWFYLYRTYGQRKLMDFLYMTRLTRNISESLSLILNSDETELMGKWRSFLKEALSEVRAEEIEPLEEGIIAAAVAPAPQRYAYARFSSHEIQYFLHLEGRVYSLPGAWRWQDLYIEPEIPMAFSASGALAWVSYEKAGLRLWLWLPDTRSYQKLPLDLVSIQDITWESERELLLSGMSSEGKVAVYSLTLPQGRLLKVAEARGDLLSPRRWRGQLWAIWQPDTSHLRPLDVIWTPLRPVVQTANEWSPLSFPPFNSATGGWITSAYQIATLSDIHGTGTAWVLGMDTSYPSALQISGLYKWVGQGDEKAYALCFREGTTFLIGVPLSQVWQEGKVFPPIIAAEALQLSLQRRAARIAFYAAPTPKQPSLPDTATAETSFTKRSPFYLFDEEGIYRPARRKKTTRSAPLATAVPFPSSQPLGKVPAQILMRDIRMTAVIHPLMRLGWHVSLSMRDPHENNEGWLRWTPYADLRSSEMSLGYLRRRGNLQFFVEGHRQSHFFSRRRYSYTFRNLTHVLRIGTRLPILPSLQAEGWGGFLQSQRFHMDRVTDRNLSARTWRWGGGVALLYQSLTYREEMPWRGWHMRWRAETYDQGKYAFLGLQVQRFQPLGGVGVLHTTLQAMGGGKNPRTLLLGGIPHWVSYEFLNRERVALLSPPEAYYLAEYVFVPGFPYHARSGRYLLNLSSVLRMPVVAWIRSFSLPVRSIYNFEWQIGYHIATTWTTGNPFSQKNPIDAQYIYRPPLVISVQTLKSPFLMSVGTGVVFRIMRMPIGLEAYWPIEEGLLRQLRLLVSFKHEIQ